MLNEELKTLTPLDRLAWWVRERWQVYKRRQAGKQKPWSSNPIMQSVYFTNVYRELDKTTVWYRENIREPFGETPEVIFATIAFRWFNWIPTGRLLLGANLLRKWNLPDCLTLLGNYQKQGEQLFTGAFNISNSGSTKPKLNRVAEDYIQPVWEKREELLSFFGKDLTLEKAHKFLGRYPGLGGSGFMAAQVIADLKYTPWLASAADWWTWCSPGPGSIRGLNRLLGRPVDGPALCNFLEEVNKLRLELGQRLPTLPPLHAQDVQNCLCEYSKMEAVLWEQGQSKRKYNGGAGH